MTAHILGSSGSFNIDQCYDDHMKLWCCLLRLLIKGVGFSPVGWELCTVIHCALFFPYFLNIDQGAVLLATRILVASLMFLMLPFFFSFVLCRYNVSSTMWGFCNSWWGQWKGKYWSVFVSFLCIWGFYTPHSPRQSEYFSNTVSGLGGVSVVLK